MRGGRGFSRGGFSRGGYRGHSGSSYRGGGSGGRGGSGSGYNGSGGRYYENSYSSSSHGSRYNSDTRSYSGGRDHSGGPPPFKRNSSHRDFRSPDRKRMRNDHQGMPPPRRSHDSYGGSADRGYSSYDKSSHYRGSGSRLGRHSHTSPPRGPPFRNARNDMGTGHRHRNDGPMAPPPSRPSRASGFRGRPAPSSRGMIRPRGGVAMGRKRIDIRMKVRSREILQQKLARMRSSLRKRPPVRSESSAKKENDDKRIKTEPSNEDDDDEKKSTKAENSSDVVSSSKVKSEGGEDKDASDIVEAENEGSVSERKDDEGKRRSSDDETLPKSRFTGKSFIKLTCIHCSSKFLTFKAYSRHLYGGAHRSTMYRLSRELKEKLTSMRLVQRSEQRELEKDLSEDELNARPHYCLLCRLSYRQEKSVHQNSEGHKSMRRFLLPFCATCKISFKTPMLYETHRCSLEHIKRKARQDAVNNRTENSDDELDLDNFMTVDSVGSVDDDPVIAEPSEGDDDKPKSDINVGSEHVKKVETLYCDLCRVYLSHRDDQERVMKVHCGVRSHLRAYLRHKEDKSLRQEAERVHRKTQEEEEKKAAEAEAEKVGETQETATEGVDDGEISTANTASQSERKGEGSEAGEEKMWADVDKDLGDLLREVEPEESINDDEDDEDSRLNSERYDRFKNSEKNAEDDQPGDEGGEKEAEEEEEEVNSGENATDREEEIKENGKTEEAA